ncbi:unnamed protein product [Ascophyllum nodosum]
MMSSDALSMLTLTALVCLASSFLAPPSTRTVVTGKSSTTTVLQASSVSRTPSDALVRTESDTCGADREIHQPKGKHYPWYSLQPLTEGLEWASSPGKYFKKMIAQHDNEPVFKIHPGLASIALTDHASGEWFFNQPDTVLDRQDGAYFGAMRCSREYLGDSLPALVTNLKESHPAVREYMLTIVRERLGSAPTALSHAAKKFYEEKRINGIGEYNGVYDFFLQQSYQFVLEFMFGTGEEGGQPLPPFEDFRRVNPLDVSPLIKLEFDTPVANGVGQLLQSIQSGVTAEEKASMDVLLESIRSSKMWPKFVKILEDQKVPTKELERSLMFNTGFQSSVPIAKSMECAVGALTANRDFLQDLQRELDGKELTLHSVTDVDQFPLLDSFHWEILRMFPGPPFYVKEAKMDLLVPTDSGNKYQVKEGDKLLCHQDLVQIDPAKFGPDAREFKPKRFVDNPQLKKNVFKFGYQDSSKPVQKDGMPWGCVAHAAGVLDGILKFFYARWVQEMDWEMNEPPIIDPDQFLGTVGPTGMSFAKITPRN